MKGRSLSGWVLGFLVGLSAAAQSGPDNDPSAAQGYVQNAFHHSAFDSINQYNGQLTVPVALGPTYTVGPKLKFQLALTYNSRVTEPGNPTDETSPNYYPVVGDPAIGVGWTLTAGKIACGALPTSTALNRPCYVRPDGAQIDFGAPNARTSDATPYELVHNGVSPNDSYTLYDGDGNRSDFAWRVAGYDDNAREAPQQGPGYARDYGRGRDGYYLTSLQDPFGNRVTVTYASGAAAPCPSACTALPIPVGSMRCTGTTALSWIPASVRIQRNGEAGATEIAQISTDPSTGRVQTVRFRTFAAGVSQFSEWTLSYDTVRLANRASNLYCPTTLPTLAGIGLPADLGGAPRYAFSYYGDGDVGPGLLRTMTVPTGATVYYDYGNYHFYHGRRTLFSESDPCHDVPSDPPPSQGVRRSVILTASGGPGHRPKQDGGAPDRYLPTQGPCLPHVDSRQYEQHLLGVVQKAVRGPAMPDAVTNYVQYSFPFGETGGTGAQTLTVALLPADADGIRRAETTLFWAARTVIDPGDPPLPGDRLGADIRTAVFESDPNPTAGTPLTTPVCGAPSEMDRLCATHAIRVTRNLYQYGSDGASLPDPDDDGNLRRLRQTTTYYGHVPTADPSAADLCPACLKHLVTWSLAGLHTWESNGRHYDTESHDGNLGGDRRVVTTAWTPQDGPRLWNLFASRVETDPDISAPTSVAGVRNTLDQSFFFDPATGFLDASLTWDARTSLYAGDCRYEDAAGNVADEVTANVLRVAGKPAANPCFSSVAAWASGVIGSNGDAFGRRSTYSGGLLSSKRWLKDRTPLSWYDSRVDRDPVTGWARTSFSPSSLATSYTDDSLGRVVRTAPPAEAPTVVTYVDARTTTVARTGADDASWQEFLYDGLGRLVREIRQMPGGYAVRAHAFDPAGHATFDSEWKACVSAAASGDCATGSATLGTRSFNFDPFGRAQSVTKTDGAATTVSFSDGTTPYSDTRKAITTSNVGCVWNGSSCSGGVSATSAYRFDAMGRVVTALEPGGDITTYGYDVAGKLVTVTQGSQVRTFAYDALGYLLRETTPEAGTVDYTVTAGGSTYSNRGSLGSPRSRVDGFGTSGAVTRSYQYDAAGRPSCEIAGSFGAGQACDSPGLNLYVRNFYDGDAFAGGAYAAGRLTQRVGYNPTFSPTTTVTDQFTYSDASGRLSRQTTSIVTGSSSATAAAQTWTYDALGLVKTHGQPRTSGTFALTFGRAFGLVTSLTAPGQPVVRTASYSPAGALAAWTAGNGVVTTITPDVSLIPRASRIQTSGAVATAAGGDFDSGIYRYDGADNVVAMGSDGFGYDARSRLTSANFGSLGAQAFVYDRFGNLTAKGGSTYAVSALTNRLSTAAYDSRGNLTANGSETLTYDLLNRHIRLQSPGVDWKYAFDGAGERVTKTPLSGSTSYTFRDEAGRISSEYVGTALGRDNMYIGDLLVASYVSSSLSGAPGWQFYASDHLGSPRLVTDLSAQVVETRKYWPYGIGVSTNPATQQRVRFSAMERDSESNRYYNHARSHDFELGRFVSPDRVGGRATAPQSWNRYAYVLGNPMKHVDPDGLLTILVHGTFAHGKTDFLPGGAFFQAVAGTIHDRNQVSFQWSGKDSHGARISAAKALSSFIQSYKFAPGEQLNIISHSHGGNVAIAAINMLQGVKVDNLVTLGTPSRPGYQLQNLDSVGNWINVYNPYDKVQTHGGGDYDSPLESGPAARTQPSALNLVWNVDLGPFGSHEALHSPAAWAFTSPHVVLEKDEPESESQ